MGHLHGTPVDPSSIDPALPPAFDAVLRQALARDPRQRHSSAGEFARALRSAAGMAPVPPTIRRTTDGRAVLPQVAVGDLAQPGCGAGRAADSQGHDCASRISPAPARRSQSPRPSRPYCAARRVAAIRSGPFWAWCWHSRLVAGCCTPLDCCRAAAVTAALVLSPPHAQPNYLRQPTRPPAHQPTRPPAHRPTRPPAYRPAQPLRFRRQHPRPPARRPIRPRRVKRRPQPSRPSQLRQPHQLRQPRQLPRPHQLRNQLPQSHQPQRRSRHPISR